jgi:hypothetical protein
VISAIGAGGMGEVYEARDPRLNRTVAIKVLLDHMSDSPEARARFEREAQLIAGLSHPHISTLHDIGRHEGTDYLVMELLEGETLAQRLERGPLPLDQALPRIGSRTPWIRPRCDPPRFEAQQRHAHEDGVGWTSVWPSFGSRPRRVSQTRPRCRDDVTSEGTILGALRKKWRRAARGARRTRAEDIFALEACCTRW